MGFPGVCGYSEAPTLLLFVLCLIGYVRVLLSRVFNALGLGDLLEPDAPWPDPSAAGLRSPARGVLLDEALPAVPFAELGRHADGCAVCLHEFDAAAEVRRLRNCRHVFHRCCLDPWVGHGNRTCPLCRAPLFGDGTARDGAAAGGVSGFFAEYPAALIVSDDQLLS